MEIRINIEKKYAFLIVGILLVIGAGLFVYAYNAAGSGGTPSLMGHSVDEINWNQFISGTVTATNFSASNGVWSSGWISAAGGISATGEISTPSNVYGGNVCTGTWNTPTWRCLSQMTPIDIKVATCSSDYWTGYCIADCPSGYIVSGGGCDEVGSNFGVGASHPVLYNGVFSSWYCAREGTSGPVKGYAVCIRVG